jgi:hypothetical protein
MIEQKAALIFWPWSYGIEELESNDLGKSLDFKLEK